jgi:DDE superfamily endonuclease
MYLPPNPAMDQHSWEGTKWLDLMVEVDERDYFVRTKKRLSAFYPTDLEFLLRNLDVDNVVLFVVAAQYASALGKNANCQTLVSLTLARGEVPVMVALRLFLPENWTSDPVRLRRTGVPIEYRAARTKPEITLAEINRMISAGVRWWSSSSLGCCAASLVCR